jgi:hypothetical protein
MLNPNIRIEKDDDIIEIDDSEFSPPDFKPSYSPPSNFQGPGLGADLLINPRKMSTDIFSKSSGSSSSSSVSSDDSSSVLSSSDSDETSDTPDIKTPDMFGNRISAERSRVEQEINEKKEILYQMDRLESKGYSLPRKFSMQSDLEEMRAEYHRVLREKEVDASIRFQRKMMMAFVTGVEFLNTRFDPFSVKLDGWSEQVHENINDYDDIFEELHDKHKSTGKKMAPELRLLLSLSGSAFMFHLTSSMFKSQQQIPGVEQVLKSDPELMKLFQQKAAQQYAGMQQAGLMNNGGGGQAAPMPQRQQNPMGGGIMGLVGNLFQGLGGGGGGLMSAMRSPQGAPPMATGGFPQQQQPKMAGPSVDSIIAEVNRDIKVTPPMASNRMETLSISDEEITSIIEDTADLGILSGNGRKSKRGGGGGKKTLNI